MIKRLKSFQFVLMDIDGPFERSFMALNEKTARKYATAWAQAHGYRLIGSAEAAQTLKAA